MQLQEMADFCAHFGDIKRNLVSKMASTSEEHLRQVSWWNPRKCASNSTRLFETPTWLTITLTIALSTASAQAIINPIEGVQTYNNNNGSIIITATTTNLQDATISTNETLKQPSEESMKFPLYMRIIATIACLLIFTVGVCGNLLVPLVVIKTKYLRNSTNLFLINLSIADLLVLIVCMPTVLIELHSRPETWLLGEPMCK